MSTVNSRKLSKFVTQYAYQITILILNRTRHRMTQSRHTAPVPPHRFGFVTLRHVRRPVDSWTVRSVAISVRPVRPRVPRTGYSHRQPRGTVGTQYSEAPSGVDELARGWDERAVLVREEADWEYMNTPSPWLVLDFEWLKCFTAARIDFCSRPHIARVNAKK